MVTKKRLILIGGFLTVFAFLAYEVATHEFLNFDTVIRTWVYERRSDGLSSIVIPITYSGNVQAVVAVGIFLLLWKKTRMTYGIPFACVSLCSSATYKIAKGVFQRPRPDVALHLIKEGGYSFPSGHSMNCLVCYGLLVYLINRHCTNRKLAKGLSWFLTILIICIGLSRIYVGVHFPTDVLGGWSLGIVFLTVSVMIIERIEKNDLQLSNRSHR